MKKINKVDYHSQNSSLKNAFVLLLLSLAVISVYFLLTNRYYMVSYIFYFVALIYLSGFPLSCILYKKKDKFKCVNCGECCRLRVKLKKSDIKRFENGKIDWIRFVDENWKLKMVNGHCIFLKEKNGKKICSVYKFRPSTCRQWPFFSNPFSISWLWFLSCPSLRKLLTK